MPENAALRRQEATRAVIRYFVLAFIAVTFMGAVVTYAIVDARADRRESYAIRVAYCLELEKLKAQNRADVAEARKHYKRNLRLLGLRDTPELRKTAEAGWEKRMRRNAPKSCPYRA